MPTLETRLSGGVVFDGPKYHGAVLLPEIVVVGSCARLVCLPKQWMFLAASLAALWQDRRGPRLLDLWNDTPLTPEPCLKNRLFLDGMFAKFDRVPAIGPVFRKVVVDET